MRKSFVHCLALGVLLGWTAATPVQADPLTVSGGHATFRLSAGQFVLTGSGFSLSGGTEGLVSPLFDCFACEAVNPITLGFSGAISGSPFGGSGGEFNGVTSDSLTLAGLLTFTGPDFSSAILSGSNLTVTRPFTFTAQIEGFSSGSDFQLGNPPLFRAQLVGGGTASARFIGPTANPEGNDLFFIRDVTYEFSSEVAATPEPASLLLLATGLAGCVTRVRGRRLSRKC